MTDHLREAPDQVKRQVTSENPEPCYECGEGALVLIKKDYHGTHPRLGDYIVPAVPTLCCNRCSLELHEDAAARMIDDYLSETLQCITPQEIRELLTKYGLTQKKAAELTGYSEKNFSRWQKGHTRPTTSVTKYLRLLLESEDAFNRLKNIKAKDQVQCA